MHRVYLTALFEYIPDCSIRVYLSFKQVLKRAHFTSVNPFLRDECMQALSIVVLFPVLDKLLCKSN